MAMKARLLPVLGPQGFLNVAYWDWEGPPGAPVVVCVHGLTRNGRDFDALAEVLSKQFRVVCPDLPGRGRSEWLPAAEDYSFAFYLAVVAALFARLDVPGLLWVGTSLGGVIGMLLASLPKNPVRRLLLNDVGPFLRHAALARISQAMGADPAFSNRQELETHLRAVHAGFGPLTEAQWRHLAAHSGRTREDGRLGLAYDPKIGEAVGAATPNDIDLWAFYDAIQCPTLVVRGGDSELLPASDAEAMTERGPRAQLIEFCGIGHAPALMADDQIGAVRAFLTAG
jgi:pimeloyl-ACP methyl ester carboxylesterase